jgi:hypothetical protein
MLKSTFFRGYKKGMIDAFKKHGHLEDIKELEDNEATLREKSNLRFNEKEKT